MMHAVRMGLVLLGMGWASAWGQLSDVQEGLAIMASRTAGNCISCHEIPAWRDAADPTRRLTLQGSFGPSLQGVGQRYSRDQLRQWVVDARVMRPHTLMPPYGTTQGLNAPARQQPLLTPAQIEAVVEALSWFTQPTALVEASPAAPSMPVLSSVEQLQATQAMNPVELWVEQGQQAWDRGCVSCHAQGDVVKAVPQFPRLDAQHRLVNLEDQINRCRQRTDVTMASAAPVEDRTTLGLSAFLHQSARQRPIQVTAPLDKTDATRWQHHLDAGERLYTTRMGHMNLSCRQCHDDKVGTAMRAQRINSAHPVGFPVYRISWQGVGSMDRRIRACLSGVQAQVPPAHDERLRQLELYLKVRSTGQPLEGPSIKP